MSGRVLLNVIIIFLIINLITVLKINHRMNEILADTIHMLAMLVHTFYKFMGLSISVEAFMAIAGSIITYYFTKKENNESEEK